MSTDSTAQRTAPSTAEPDYDVVIIGSGFGGSVSALRLVEKGYKVAVIEAGARFEDEDFAETSFDLKKFLFRPEIGCYGIQRIDAVRDSLILAGAGVGGGSLVYANTLYEPLAAFYKDEQWRDITDWKDELAPYYDQAKRMLGVVENPLRTPSDDVMEKVANDLGVGDTFHPTPVGVFFGGPDAQRGEHVEDPYFGGAGPDRNTCIACGGCMTGCRYNAKNTLMKNYLYLAEQRGAKVMALTTVTRVEPGAEGGYDVTIKFTKAKRPSAKSTRTITAGQVIFAAAAIGTQKLLHRMKVEGHLPELSDRLGYLSRTNSEAILGAIAPDRSVDYSYGIAITSSFHPDEDTHVEPCRYGKGSNAMAMMQTVLTDGDVPGARWQTWLKELWREKRNVRSLYDLKHWSERTVVALVMQTLGQLDHDVPREDPRHQEVGPDLPAGSRQAEPHLDPDRQQGRPQDGRRDGRDRRWLHRRAVQHADDRALHRRLRHRDQPREGRGRPLPAGLQLSRPAHRRRLGDLGQPRREPVAHDHGPGRARDVVLAQQGRGGRPTGPRLGVRAPRARGPEEPGGSGVRSWGLAASDRQRQLRAAGFPGWPGIPEVPRRSITRERH